MTLNHRAKPRVLVVDDDAEAREVLAELFIDCGFAAGTAGNGKEALAEADQETYDLVLSDIRMGEMNGLELVKRLRSRNDTADVPVILMSSVDDELGRVRGLEYGADDFLPKPLHFDELMARIRVQLRRGNRVRELTRTANVDELTGLLNRRGLFSALRGLLEQARVEHLPCSALLIDVDAFKAINDTYGHACGDDVLRAVARALETETRATDRVGRLGGDEFVAVLAGATEDVARRIAARLNQALSLPAHLPKVGLSVGVARARPNDTLETLLARADQAMYVRKSGRFNVVNGDDTRLSMRGN